MKNTTISVSYLSSFLLVMVLALWSPVELSAQTAAETALIAELTAAAGDPDALAAIIARENAAGNTDGLASALADAATTLAATDISGAATLMIQAVTVAEDASDDVQDDVGDAASVVATTASESGDNTTAAEVETAVASSTDADLQISYVDAGGSAGTGVTFLGNANNLSPTGAGNQNNDVVQQDQNNSPTGGQNVDPETGIAQTATDETSLYNAQLTVAQGTANTTGLPQASPPPPPPVGGVVIIPIPIEPNPSQSGSPT